MSEQEHTRPDSAAYDLLKPKEPQADRLNRRALVFTAIVVVLIMWAAVWGLARHNPAASNADRQAMSPSEKRAFDEAQALVQELGSKVRDTERQLHEQQALMSRQGPSPSAPGYMFGLSPKASAQSQPEIVGQSVAPPRAFDRDEYVLPPSDTPGDSRNADLGDGRTHEEQALSRALQSSLIPASFSSTFSPPQGSRPASDALLGPGQSPGELTNPSTSALTPLPAMPEIKIPSFQPPDLSQLNPRSADAAYLQRKDEFLVRAGGEPHSRTLPSTLQVNPSPFRILAGALLPSILTTGINSDLPGQVSALVSRDVFDTITGHYLLIPQGSRLLGQYDNRIAYGQKRVLLAWDRLVFPDGRSLDLRGMPGADLAAAAGLKDSFNTHFASVFGHALLLSAITAGAQLSQPRQSANNSAPSASQIASAALGQELANVTGALLQRQIDVQPTLEIRPGYLFLVEVTADMLLPGPYNYNVIAPASPSR